MGFGLRKGAQGVVARSKLFEVTMHTPWSVNITSKTLVKSVKFRQGYGFALGLGFGTGGCDSMLKTIVDE
jgi:hypothetical protein